METQKGWDRQTMIGFYKKESTYDGGVTMDASPENACSLSEHELNVSTPDKVQSNKGQVTGYEHGTDSKIITQGVKINIKMPQCKPNDLIGFFALLLGGISSTQDGAYGWKHVLTPVTVGTALPSTQMNDLFAGIHTAYTGLKGEKGKLAFKAGMPLSLEADLLGSGSRATPSPLPTFAPEISESWMMVGNMYVRMETGANISIDAAPTQGAEGISSATPDDLAPRWESGEFQWDNKPKGQYGAGGGLVFRDIDYGVREAGLKFTLLFYDETEMGLFLAQTPCAIELDIVGALINPLGNFYYGGRLMIPRFKIKENPLPQGGAGDTVICDIDCDIQDDKVDPVVTLTGYNNQAAYLAA